MYTYLVLYGTKPVVASKIGKISCQVVFETWQSAKFSTSFVMEINPVLKTPAKYDSMNTK